MATRTKSPDGNTDAAKVRNLNVYLLKPSVKTFKDALDKDADVDQIELKQGFGFKGVIFRERTEQNAPVWKEFLQEGTDDPLKGLANQHQSVLLLIKPTRCARIFAFLFGYARSLLNQSSYETDFGLKVVLNVVDPEKLRSMDAATLDEIPVQTRKQASRVSALELFDVDRDADMLRALTGTPMEKLADGTVPHLGRQISGSSSLLIHLPIYFSELGDLGKELLGLYERDDYKKHGFEWVDHLRPVKDRDVIDKLDNALLDTLQRKDVDEVALTPPEAIDWTALRGIRFGLSKKNEFPNFLIDEFYQFMTDPSEWTIEDLKKTNVNMIHVSTGEPTQHFPIYRCLAFGHRLGGKQYVLTGGAWFNIDVDFAKRVTDYIEALPEAAISLRPFTRATDLNEGQYSENVCKAAPNLALMDRKLVRPTGARTPIEVCDIFSELRQFIHIKPFKGSSTLSHLFAQGQVSADLFQWDEGFRDQARKKVASVNKGLAKLIQSGSGMAKVSEFEVVFAVIKKKPKPGAKWQHSLPFFAQLHLMQVAEALRSKTYRVALKLIEEH